MDKDTVHKDSDSSANASSFLESPTLQVPSSSRKRSKRDSDGEAFGDFLNKMTKIAETRFAVPSVPKESSTHEGFFLMVREYFDDMPSNVIKEAKLFILNYLREIESNNKK